MNPYRIFTFLVVCTATLMIFSAWPEALAQGEMADQIVKAGADKEPETLLDLIAKGGALMIPIGICSVIAVYVIIWQFLALRREQVLPAGFQSSLRNSLGEKGNDVESGLAFCNQVDGPIARIFKAGIPKIGQGEQVIEKAIEDAGFREIGKMKRNLRSLSAIATISPLLGLLGTVYGMIGAFQAASNAGAGKADTLAKGIYEALVTTAAGLSLAIPVLIFYQILNNKIDSIVDEVDDIAIDFLEHSGGAKKAPAKRTASKRGSTSKAAVATA
ncbi:MAG: MotA/TolQ/ExbB proton channel family protein [Opitutales bacterium]